MSEYNPRGVFEKECGTRPAYNFADSGSDAVEWLETYVEHLEEQNKQMLMQLIKDYKALEYCDEFGIELKQLIEFITGNKIEEVI